MEFPILNYGQVAKMLSQKQTKTHRKVKLKP